MRRRGSISADSQRTAETVAVVSSFTVNPLGPLTWADFAALVEPCIKRLRACNEGLAVESAKTMAANRT
jgi:hypothetical protein